MAIRTSNSVGGDFEKAPEGMRVARCYKIVDCGTHLHPTWGKEQHIVWIHFELPTTLMQQGENAGKPFSIGNRYALSHHEKANLRLDLESWYGKKFDTVALDSAGGFDLTKLVGRAALINIVHSEDGKYANIKSINPLVDGMKCPKQVNPSFIFDLSEFDQFNFDKLSEKMKEFIKQSKEYKERMGMLPTKSHNDSDFDDFVDDIPF